MTTAAHRRTALLACVFLILAALWGCGRKSQDADTVPPLVADVPAPEDSPTASEEVPAAEAAEPASDAKPADPEPLEKPEPPPEKPKPTEPEIKPKAPAIQPIEAKPKPAPPTPKEIDREEPPIKKQPAAPEVPSEARPEKPKGTTVVGKITLVSNVPDPSTVTYKDCVTFIKYQVENVESGDYQGNELLAVFWGMRDSKLQPPARFSTGQRHRLTIQPLSARPELERMMRADDTNDYSLIPYWVVSYSGK